MAFSTDLHNGVVVTTGAATATAATQPADNCYQVVVYNEDATDSALFGFVTAATVLTATNGFVLPAKSAITLRIGTAKYRPCGPFGGLSGVVLRTKNNGAGTPVLNFQFVNASGDVAP